MICPLWDSHGSKMGYRPSLSKGKIRVFLPREELFAIVVCSVGVSEYGNFRVQAQEILINTGATNTAVLILGR